MLTVELLFGTLLTIVGGIHIYTLRQIQEVKQDTKCILKHQGILNERSEAQFRINKEIKNRVQALEQGAQQ